MSLIKDSFKFCGISVRLGDNRINKKIFEEAEIEMEIANIIN